MRNLATATLVAGLGAARLVGVAPLRVAPGLAAEALAGSARRALQESPERRRALGSRLRARGIRFRAY